MRFILPFALLTLAACAVEREIPTDLVCNDQAALARNGTTDGETMTIHCPVSRY